MDAVEMLGKFDEIVETDDKNVASEKIVEFKEYINDTAATDASLMSSKDEEIAELKGKVEKLTSENEEVRKHNTDILLKYGAMAEKMAANVGEFKPEPKKDTPKTWGEISRMD